VTDFFKGLENETVVGARVLSGAPQAIIDEVANDWNNNRTKLLTNVAVSAGIGLGAELLLGRSPVLASTALTAFGVYQGGKYLMHSGEFMGKAWDASTKQDRDALVNSSLTSIGKEGAFMLEGAGGFAAGGLAGSVALGKSAALEGFAYRVTEKYDMPARWLLPEKLSWIGPGTKTLPESVLGKEGAGVDALKISEMLSKPWSGVERAQSIDLATGKVSRAMPGTPNQTTLGFRDTADRIWFHDHGPHTTFRPSVYDVGYTQNMGILQHGNTTVFFEGAAKNVLADGSTTAPIQLRGLAMDNQTKTAYLIDTVFNPKKSAWEPSIPQYVDWAKARQTLSALDVKNPFAQFDAIPRLPDTHVSLMPEHVTTLLGRASSG
jgi:hypothetical protein